METQKISGYWYSSCLFWTKAKAWAYVLKVLCPSEQGVRLSSESFCIIAHYSSTNWKCWICKSMNAVMVYWFPKPRWSSRVSYWSIAWVDISFVPTFVASIDDCLLWRIYCKKLRPSRKSVNLYVKRTSGREQLSTTVNFRVSAEAYKKLLFESTWFMSTRFWHGNLSVSSFARKYSRRSSLCSIMRSMWHIIHAGRCCYWIYVFDFRSLNTDKHYDHIYW